MKYNPKDIERFWLKVNKECSQVFYNGTRCWEWMAGCDKDGYGHAWIGGRDCRAPRFSYELAFGKIPENKPCVLHYCDNPLCVRPEHLHAGTNKENSQEMVKRGRLVKSFGEANGSHTHPERVPRGEANGYAKLTEAQVTEIRTRHDSGEMGVVLARDAGVSTAQISKIVNNKQRKLLP